MNTFSHAVPPGFRFHPTDEELVNYYLRNKVNNTRIDLDVIKHVDLYKIEPWDLQEICKIGSEELKEWYFFSHKDKKYPTGTRTNRATAAGFWKATGRDKPIYNPELIGMRKTLVFYKGRAPNGQKSDWIMHEYRLETDENGTPQEEGWVVCRAFKKKIATLMRSRINEHDQSPIWYDDQVSFIQDHSFIESSDQHHFSYPSSKKEQYYDQFPPDQHHFLQLPLLQSPKLQPTNSSFMTYGFNMNVQTAHQSDQEQSQHEQVADWRVLDKFVASQTVHQSDQEQSQHEQVADWRVLDKFVASQTVHQSDQEQSQHEQVADWRVLDKFVASQLSQEEIMCKENDQYNTNQVNIFQDYDDDALMMIKHFEKHDILTPENTVTTSYS